MHDIWNKVCYESSLKRKWIKELDEIYAKYESERKAMVCGLYYVKHMFPESKISYLMPCDVHRLIDSEAMVMINQALLANRRALAKLCLNLMEKHLQMDIFQRLRWEEKLQDWKQIKLNDGVTRFTNATIFSTLYTQTEVSTYGFTSDEIQNIVNVEILPLIGQRQSQTEVYLEKLDKAFECLAKTAAYDSKCLFKFMCGAAQLWENHCAVLQELQAYSHSVSQLFNVKEIYGQVHIQPEQCCYLFV
uniref:DUF4455 domain-containing protein n=1 Tax=Sinocyclocheilus rhinocerous TaxID=307959 RepID=A0A673M9M1_9TELE